MSNENPEFTGLLGVRVRKALGIALMVAGITGIINWLVTPRRHLEWRHDEAAAFAEARQQGKGVMIDFSASWCAPCIELEATFADERVFTAIGANYVPLKFDVTQGTARDEAMQSKYRAETLPAVIFLDGSGRERARISEYLPPDRFLAAMDRGGGGGGANKFASALERGWFWAFLAAFGFGFLTSLTPCVYPMIPIVVGVFGARETTITRRKAAALSSSYVLGMGVMYAALGVSFALIGKQTQFGSILGNPWVVVPVVLFYLALAASMFGAFEINLPASWQSRLGQVGGSGLAGAFAMGLVGGLTAAPCTGPFLAGMLAFVATTGSVLLGGAMLFVYALGMGVLFWAIGAFAVSLPRSGRWMEAVKSVGGIALLVVAIYFLRPILPALTRLSDPSPGFLAGSAVVALIGLALGAVHLSFAGPAHR